MKIGITGLKSSGKTTVFNALTGETTDYHTPQKESNIAIVKVPDKRLDSLFNLFHPQKKVNATIEFIDVRGIETGERVKKGLSTDVISNLKICDALLPVIRIFKEDTVVHPEGNIDIIRDIEIINTELMISDMDILESRVQKVERLVGRKKDEGEKEELDLLMKCKSFFDEEKPLREADFTSGEEKLLRGFQFLTQKPLIYVINIDENSIPGAENILIPVRKKYHTPCCEMISLCGKLEEELSRMEDEESEEFREEYGLKESAIRKLIRVSYDLFGLISFFTMVEKEVRSWTIPANTRAKSAAGAIHTDMEKGFIKAEVIPVADLIESGSTSKCREKGILKLEGKDYIVQDGDFITFKFSK